MSLNTLLEICHAVSRFKEFVQRLENQFKNGFQETALRGVRATAIAGRYGDRNSSTSACPIYHLCQPTGYQCYDHSDAIGKLEQRHRLEQWDTVQHRSRANSFWSHDHAQRHQPLC